MVGGEIEFGGHTYRLGTLSAKTQLHILRRIGPVIGALGGDGNLMAKVLTAIGELSDADTDFVVDRCLEGCSRKQDGDKGWAPVFRNGQLMFEDLGLAGMLQLTKASLELNLGDFFTAGLSLSGAATS